jgi:hypothetical protein
VIFKDANDRNWPATEVAEYLLWSIWNQDTHFAGFAHPSYQDNRIFSPAKASLEQTMPTLPALISQGRFRRLFTEESGFPIESAGSSSVCLA